MSDGDLNKKGEAINTFKALFNTLLIICEDCKKKNFLLIKKKNFFLSDFYYFLK